MAVDNEITDMAWDKNEDHLIVSFGNGAMAMVDYGGFNEGQTNWKVMYEPQKSNKVNNIMWKDDKSGDFLTSTRRVGAIRVWNVASTQPKEIVKVGSHGIH